MALHIVKTGREDVVSPAAVGALRQALRHGGRSVLLAPSFERSLDAQRALAGVEGLGLGVQATTPLAWAGERWGVWGDGRRIVDGLAREALCLRVVVRAAAREGSLVKNNPGMRSLLSGLVSRGLPSLRGDGRPEGLTDAEAAVASLARDYDAELTSLGLVEACDVMELLPGVLSQDGGAQMVAVGLENAPACQLRLLARLSLDREVTVVLRALDAPAAEPGREAVCELIDLAKSEGAPFDVAEERGCEEPGRPAELSALAASLFVHTDNPVPASGAVRVVLPAGPSAELAAIAEEVCALARASSRSVAVVAPDAAFTWRGLAGRLAARGISSRARLRAPLRSTESGRALLELVDGVSSLAELAAEWPAPRRLPNRDVRVDLRDMSWWPPRGLSDFLASRISGVDAARARALDAQWRSNRLLTPAAVLEQLQNERSTSAACAAAVRELLRGRVGSCASKLLAPIVEDGKKDDSSLEAVAVLGQALSVGMSLKECGYSAGDACGDALALRELWSAASALLSNSNVAIRPERIVEGSACMATILPASSFEAAPLSFDAVVLCGQTSVESPVSAADDVLHAMLGAYGVERPRSAMAAARARLDAALRAARRSVSFERCLFSADSKECFCGVMMSEALACYGLSASASADEVTQVLGEESVPLRGELQISENAAEAGAAPISAGGCRPSPAGRIDAALASCVMPPQEGSASGLPLLSASQIETYLECPYKWFSLRRLRLHDADAGFGGAEAGTFAHRVLEVTHRNLLASAKARAEGTGALFRIEAEDPEGMQSEAYVAEAERLVALAQADPSARLAGSRVDVSTLDAARVLLSKEFDGHLSHQYQLKRGKRPMPQALVPHTSAEEGSLVSLRRDLESLLGYESEILAGFEPRYFEWSFGKRGTYVEYAGVQLTGTVDRIDVDAHGQAAVIDYKHKGARGFASEYDAFGEGGAAAAMGECGLILPRRVQSLIYGQVVRRAFPQLKVVSAVYLCTKASHELAGAVDAEAADNVFGLRPPSSRRLPKVEVPRSARFGDSAGSSGIESLLDACEEAIAAKLERMMAGDIEADPVDAHACDYCPVLNCEKRCSK